MSWDSQVNEGPAGTSAFQSRLQMSLKYAGKKYKFSVKIWKPCCTAAQAGFVTSRVRLTWESVLRGSAVRDSGFV